MSIFLISLGIAGLGAANIFLSRERETKEKLTIFATVFVLGALVFWGLNYLIVPTLAHPLFGLYGIELLILLIVTAAIGYDWIPIIPPVLYVLLLIGTLFFGLSIFHADSYSRLIGDIKEKNQKHWSQEVQPLDPAKIRLVPQEWAISLAKTNLSQEGASYGSQFPLSFEHITLQKIKDEYWYLIPLDFKGWSVWASSNYVPGYVKVSATDPNAKPVLVNNRKMKYTPGAYFGDNLERCLITQYPDYILSDYSFEEDDNGNIYWVVTASKLTIGYWGEKVQGIILVNPETGVNQFVPQEEINKNSAYAWIDRVVPMDLIRNYIGDWGDLRGGWWNKVFSHNNLLKAETPTLNYAADGSCVIVTPVTSNTDRDDAMTGLMYTNARTGESVYYSMSGGATESSLLRAVNDAVAFRKWTASGQMVFENIFGKLSALVPVLSENGNYQGLAIVECDNKKVSFGTNAQEALNEHQKNISTLSGQITTENIKNFQEYSGEVVRLGWEMSGNVATKQYYLYFKDFKQSFAANGALTSELSLTREGDKVIVRYFATNQTVIPVVYFRNLSLDLSSSTTEQQIRTQAIVKKDSIETKADVKDFRESIKDKSDEEIKEIIKQNKK